MKEFVVASFCALAFWWGVLLGEYTGHRKAMHEALDMGLAVQCVGKSGVYWECD